MEPKAGGLKQKIGDNAEVALYVCFMLYVVNIYLSRTISVIDFPSFSLAGSEVSFGMVRTVVGLVLIVAALCAFKFLDAAIRKRSIMMAAALGNLIGMALILVASYLPLPLESAWAPAMAVVGFGLTSAAGILLALVVAQLFVDNRSEVKWIVVAFFVAMALNALVALIGFFVHMFLLMALPFAVWGLWGPASSKEDSRFEGDPRISRDDVNFVPLIAGYFLFIFAFSLSTSFSRWQYLSDGASNSLIRCVIMLLATALVGLVIYLTRRSYLRFNTIALYRATFLFFIVSLCFTLFAPKAVELAYSIQFVSDMILRTLIFVTVYRICQRYGFSVTLILCAGALVRHCASILFNMAEGTTPLFNTMALAGIIILLLAVVYTVAFTERNLETLTERRKPRAEAVIVESKMTTLGERFGLTKRETEVAKLLSQGRTVAFIADELFVSPRTVSTHVTNIYGKMGIHTRQDFLDIFQETPGASSRTLDE